MNGYIETQEHVDWRMNRRRLQDIEATYGEDWEKTADAIRPLIAAAEAGDTFLDVWSFVDTGLNDDRPYRPGIAEGDYPF